MNYRMRLYHDDKEWYAEHKDALNRYLKILQPSYYITQSQDFCHDFITEYIWCLMDAEDEAAIKERLRKIVRKYSYLQYEGGKIVEYKEGMVGDDDSS